MTECGVVRPNPAAGEIVALEDHTPVGQDVEIIPLAAITMVLDQTGAPWSVTTWAWSVTFRADLVGWATLNEHQDDDLAVADNADLGAVQSVTGVQSLDRKWNLRYGWYLYLRPFASVVSLTRKNITDNFSGSFWLMPEGVLSSGGVFFRLCVWADFGGFGQHHFDATLLLAGQ